MRLAFVLPLLSLILAASVQANGPIVESCNPALFPRSKLTRAQITQVVGAVRASLENYQGVEFVLTRSGAKLNSETKIPSAGFSFAAANAVYHLLGGAEAGLHPMQASYYDPLFADVAPETEGRAAHWWIRDADGNIIDPTYDQFTRRGVNPPYEKGSEKSFGAKDGKPLANAIPLIRDAKQTLSLMGLKKDGSEKRGRR